MTFVKRAAGLSGLAALFLCPVNLPLNQLTHRQGVHDESQPSIALLKCVTKVDQFPYAESSEGKRVESVRGRFGQMDDKIRPPFQAALLRFRNAKNRIGLAKGEAAANRAVEAIDRALDDLLAVPSPSLGAFGEKVRILKGEYGLAAQPRHIGAIYADVAVLAALYADSIYQAWPVL